MLSERRPTSLSSTKWAIREMSLMLYPQPDLCRISRYKQGRLITVTLLLHILFQPITQIHSLHKRLQVILPGHLPKLLKTGTNIFTDPR